MRANTIYVFQPVQQRSRPEHLQSAPVAVSREAPPALHQVHGHCCPALLAGHCEFGLTLFLFIHVNQSVSQCS